MAKYILFVCTENSARSQMAEDWRLEDPDERPIEKFRDIRDAIEQRIKKLISELH